MDRLTLHIGLHKTGTSTIQNTLAHHPALPGFTYIQLRHPNGSLAILQGFSARFTTRMAARTGQMPTEQDLALLRHKARLEFARRIAAVPTGHGLISAEALSFLSEDELRKLRQMAAPQARRLDAIAYVREPRAFLQSVFQQLLRNQMPRALLELPYRDKLAAYDRVLGPGNMTLRLYDRARLPQGCVMRDLAGWLGLEIDPTLIRPSNPGLSRPAIELLYCYRSQCPRPAPRDPLIIDRLLGLPGPALRFSDRLYRHHAAPWQDQIDWLQERLGGALRLSPEEEGAIDSFDALLAPSPEALDWLGRETGRATGPLRGDPAAIAAAVQSLKEA